MRTIRQLCFTCIAFILYISSYAGDHQGWTMTNFNNENGLPQNSIRFAQMDNDGYLWLATQAGIVRYDGQRFRLFDNSNSALKLNRYWTMGKNKDGYIYCVDEALEISFYNNRTGFSKPVVLPSVVPMADGGLMDFSQVDMGKLAPFTNKITHSSYPDAGTFVFHPTGEGRGFVIWNSWLAGYVSNGKVRRVDTIDYYRGTQLAIGCVGDKLCYISKNKDFVLVDSNGVHRRQKIPFAVPWDKLMSHFTVLSFFQQEHQMLFHIDGDVYEVALNGDALEFHHFIAVKDIPFVDCIRYYPDQNLLVVGSNTRGLFLFKKQQFLSTGKNAANPDAFYALAPYGNKQVIATSGRLPNSPAVPGVFDAINRFTILRDRNKNYWYGSGYTLLQTDDRFRVLKSVPLPLERLGCVQEDDRGTIWLSLGQREFGRLQGDTFQRYMLDSIDGKGHKSINAFIPAGNQTFWLVGYRLCIWLDVKHHRQRIYHEFDNIELRTAYIDKKGRLWVGSYGKGYYLFRNGRFIKMPEDRGYALSIVHCFQEDSRGSLWMTTNNGLFQCAINDLYDYADGKRTQVYHHYYGKESGLKVSEFNGGCTPSGLKLGDGSFAFPSMEGVVLFHPDSIKPLLPVNKLFIEHVLIDGAPVSKTGLSRIAPSFKRMELTVSSPYFGNPNNFNVEYNIDGLDEHWYSLGENDRIVLNRLKYGHYKLRLRKEAGFGAGNYITAELPLVVMPFYHQTWWFRVIVGVSLLLFILLVIRIRYKYLIRQRNRLEAEVKDRTHALVYNNKLMEKLTVMIAHDLKSPLYFLSKVTGRLRNNVQQENFEEVDRTSAEIKNTADQVYQFIEGFNLWASSFTEGFVVHKTFFPLDSLLQELGLFFKEMLDANENRLLIATPANYILYTDRELLKVILRNIIDNANKHTQSCDISLSAHTETDQHVSLIIADNGGGMSKHVLKSIQDRIALASTAAGIERNSRLGYQMIIDFATRLALKLDVQSDAGRGTSVTLLHLEGKISESSPSQDLAQKVIGTG